MKLEPQPLIRHRHGFTIIELMIVLALISILAIIAIPTYQRYSVRAQISEGINLIKPFRYAIYEYYTQEGGWPSDNASAGMNPPDSYQTKYIESIAITRHDNSANITIKYKIPALGDNDTLIFYTTLVNTRVRWHCDYGTVDDKFRPQSCQSD